MAEVAEYQKSAIDKLLEFVQQGDRNVLEIGSDLDCAVISSLTGLFSGTVVGLNPSADFPRNGAGRNGASCHAMRSDGCHLPFHDSTFDAIISVATMEHVGDLDRFLAECSRVLRPGGILYTKFSPIWSCGIGHHVFAVAGHKEARFWKPGKNPLPDFSHLIWDPQQMREFLHSGPCDDRLIEPIISWVYHDSDISRRFLEDYLTAFRKSTLRQLVMNLIPSAPPSAEMAAQLRDKYGPGREFRCQGIEAVFSKIPDPAQLNREGEEMYGRGDIDGAFSTFTRVLEIDPEFAQAYNNLGVLHWDAGEAEKAVRYFQKARQISPDDRDTLVNCGMILTAIGSSEDAAKLYMEFLERHPDDPEIRERLYELSDKKSDNKKEFIYDSAPGQDRIDILSLDLIDEYRHISDMVYDLGKKLNIGLGWHYLLDIIWIVLNIRDLPKGSVVLDAGAGNGLLQCVLAGLGYRVISVDFFPRQVPPSIKNNWNVTEVDGGTEFDNEYIRQLKDNFAYKQGPVNTCIPGAEEFERALHTGEKVIIYYRADFTDMKLIRDNSVDCVVSLSALEHNEKGSIKKAVSEFSRVLKAGGRMVVTVSAAEGEDWYHEQSKGWCFTEKTLVDIFDLYSYQSNFHLYNELFDKLKDGKGLKEILAPVYFKSGNNGMPWGVWAPAYQPVGIVKHNSGLPGRISIIEKCGNIQDEFRAGSRFLQQVFLDVNNSCNLSCVMCSRDNTREPARNMTPDEFRVIADKCFRHVRNLQISCAWEASLSRHFPKILSSLPGYEIPFISFLTNGNFMTDELIEAFFSSGLNRLVFSFEETDRAIYERIRVKGDFTRLLRNIGRVAEAKELRGLKLPQLGANMTIMKSNIEQMPGFVEFAAGLGIEVITGRHLILLEDCETGGEVLSGDIGKTNSIIAEAAEIARHRNIMFNVPFMTRNIERKSLCTRPWDSLYILANGDVSSCPRISRTRTFGNLITEGFHELFFRNTTTRKLRDSFVDGEPDNMICRWCVNGMEQREAIDQQF